MKKHFNNFIKEREDKEQDKLKNYQIENSLNLSLRREKTKTKDK